MTWMTLFRRAFPTALGLVALSALAPMAVAAEELVFRACPDYCAEIDGVYAPDARFFATDSKGRLLVELPSLSTSAVIKVKANKVVAVPRSSIRHGADESTARLVDPITPDASASEVSMEGSVWTFKINDSEVRIRKASECRTVAAPMPTNGPIMDDSTARKCLHLETRPIVATAGCSKGAFLKNSCDVPVVAVVQTIQRLFSGTLPQTSSVVIPPGVDYPLGCAWSSGAMAPTEFQVLAAAFVTKRIGSRPGEQASTGH